MLFKKELAYLWIHKFCPYITEKYCYSTGPLYLEMSVILLLVKLYNDSLKL